jgi:hypothetical protein
MSEVLTGAGASGRAPGAGAEAAGARRRRFTIAPRATGNQAHSRHQTVPEVWDASFADSDRSGEECEPSLDAWSSGACNPQSDPLSGFRKEGCGSRFWLLSDELSSDEGESAVVRCVSDGVHPVPNADMQCSHASSVKTGDPHGCDKASEKRISAEVRGHAMVGGRSSNHGGDLYLRVDVHLLSRLGTFR